MRIQLGICLRDQEYAEKISQYLNRVGKERMEVRIGDPDSCPEAEYWLTDTPDPAMVTRTILMETEENAADWQGERIEPYLPGSRLYRQVLQAVGRLKEGSRFQVRETQPMFVREALPVTQGLAWNVPEETGKGKILAVYSPIGGVGKTTFAVTLARILAGLMPEGRVLYLNLEGASDWKLYFQSDCRYDLSDLIYGMLLEDLSDSRMREIVRETVSKQPDGLCFIEPSIVFDDLDVLEEGEIDQLLSGLCSCFDYVVCDLGILLHRVTREVLLESSLRFFLSAANETAGAKWQDFLKSLDRQQIKDALLGTGAVCVRILQPGSRERRQEGFTDLITDADPQTEKDGIRRMRADTEWHRRISELALEVTGLGG